MNQGKNMSRGSCAPSVSAKYMSFNKWKKYKDKKKKNFVGTVHQRIKSGFSEKNATILEKILKCES